MKMSCYFLVQDSRKYVPISTEENILRVRSCWVIVTVRIKMMARLHKWLSRVIIVLLAMVLLIVFSLYHNPILSSNTCITQLL